MAYFLPSPTNFSSLPFLGSNAFVSGLEMNVISMTQFTINPGAARDLISDFVISFSPYSAGGTPVLTVDVSTRGLNGCYPYLPNDLNQSINIVYPVYIVGNTAGNVNTAIIVATGDEFLPPTMNAYRRIGWIYINSATSAFPGTIDAWTQSGSGNDRSYVLTNQRHRLISGTQTGFTSFSLTSGSGVENGVVPPKPNVTVFCTAYMTVVSAGTGANISYTSASQSFISPIYIRNPVITLTTSYPFTTIASQDPVTGDSILYYQVTTSGNVLSVDNSGFVDSLGPTLY